MAAPPPELSGPTRLQPGEQPGQDCEATPEQQREPERPPSPLAGPGAAGPRAAGPIPEPRVPEQRVPAAVLGSTGVSSGNKWDC